MLSFLKKILFQLPNVQWPLYLAWKVQLDELSSVRVRGGGGEEALKKEGEGPKVYPRDLIGMTKGLS